MKARPPELPAPPPELAMWRYLRLLSAWDVISAGAEPPPRFERGPPPRKPRSNC
jgi:hypothetical protein